MLNVEEPMMVYPDKRKAIRRLQIRLLCIGMPIMLLAFCMLSLSSVPLDGFTNALRWLLLAECPLLYLLVSKSLQKQSKPIVALSAQGITVDTLATHVGFLRWDEIKEVRAYNLMYRFIGITLKDPKTVYRRIGLKRSWMLRMNDLVIPLYKLVRIPVAPINIPQEYLPISADELLTQIEAYRTTYS